MPPGSALAALTARARRPLCIYVCILQYILFGSLAEEIVQEIVQEMFDTGYYLVALSVGVESTSRTKGLKVKSCADTRFQTKWMGWPL